MWFILKHEWLNWLRNRVFAGLGMVLLLLLVVVCFSSVQQYQEQKNSRQAAKQEVRAQWENMGPSNPHGAAHFGSYAFKPLGPLSFFDGGLQQITGSNLRLEGHVQNELVNSPASQGTLVSRFGVLNPALLLQLIFSFLLLLLGFDAVRQERIQGRWSLLLHQSKQTRRLLFAKALAIWLLAMLLLLVLLVLGLIWAGNNLVWMRWLYLLKAYGLFFWLCIVLGIALAARLRQANNALTWLVSIWVLWVLVSPRFFHSVAEQLHPLPSRFDFEQAMREDRAKGIDGHNPADGREKALRDSVLQAHGVTVVDSLPFNFDGLIMQADEEYGNMVWDKHLGGLHQTLLKQQEMLQWLGMANPFMALKRLSMGIAGTDLSHHLDFQEQAEIYRRQFIKKLNYEHAYGGSKTGDWSWEASQDFFNSIADFHYQLPAYSPWSKRFWLDWLVLLSWCIGLSALVWTFKGKAENL